MRKSLFSALLGALASVALTFSMAMPHTASARSMHEHDSTLSQKVASQGTVEVAFAPNEGAESLVIRAIDSAHTQIRMLAYNLTSPPIVDALIAAHDQRHVEVHVIADLKANTTEDFHGVARIALNRLAAAHIDVRVISAYSLQHDKLLIIDDETTQTGSFNYTLGAAHLNSEYVMVNWNNRPLAQVFVGHFLRNYQQSVPYSTVQ